MTDGEFDPKFNDKPHNEVTVGLHEIFAAGDRENRLLQEATMELLERNPEYDGLHVIHRNSVHEQFNSRHTYDAFIQVQCKGSIHSIRDMHDLTDEQIKKGYKMSVYESAHRIFDFVQKISHKFNYKKYTTVLHGHEFGSNEDSKHPVTVYTNYKLPEGSIVVSPDVEMFMNVNMHPGGSIIIPYLKYDRE